MFDYIMFLQYGSAFLGVIFLLRMIVGIYGWYYFEKTPTGRLDYTLNYTMKGLQITHYGIGRNFIYAAVCVLIFFSIK